MFRIIKNKFSYQFKELDHFPLTFIFSLRQAKDMRKKDNLISFLEKLNPSANRLVIAKCLHSSKVVLVESGFKKEEIFYCDSLVTQDKRTALAIFTADCLSIFLYDLKNEAIGLIHAGWRSTKEEIVFKTIKIMKDKFFTKAGDLFVGFGPAIRNCCYEVGEEFKRFFSSKYLSKRRGKLYFDLVKINRDRLISCGVKKERIYDCAFCTSCYNDILFSFRKEADTAGRIVSLAMLH
ncbi:MAG: peptidoglycan editing factor PgeF [Candidatus Omnitrophica bacterium]|nr:peptidoglycan editing factor PgeF [Candidatus Omnitrophota bacterium]